jgi:Na+-driven multidrug efflux pump
MFVTLVSIWIVRVPIALVLGLGLGLGLAGAWVGIAADVALRGTVFFFRFRSGRWKSIEV